VGRPTLEVADIFRDHGPAWRDANRGHVSLDQLKVMSAIERCGNRGDRLHLNTWMTWAGTAKLFPAATRRR